MKFIWEAADMVAGLNIVQPTKGVTAVIGWVGGSSDGLTIVETNTDGRISYKHEKGEDGELVVNEKGELNQIFSTPEELAEQLNEGQHRHMWVPLAMFSGTGSRLKWGKNGYRDDMVGLKEITVFA